MSLFFPLNSTPHLYKILQLTLSVAYTKSNRPSTVTDTPRAGPLITPIKGFGKSMKAATKRLQFKIKRTMNKSRKSVYHVCQDPMSLAVSKLMYYRTISYYETHILVFFLTRKVVSQCMNLVESIIKALTLIFLHLFLPQL